MDYKHNKLTNKQRRTAETKKEQNEDEVLDRKVARQNKEGIDGLNFVMTGSLSTFKNRTELKTFIESKGGKLLSSITPKVDYLIRNYSDGSEKESKALELEIEIIDEYRFNELAGRVFEIDESGILMSYYGGNNAVIPQSVTKIAVGAFDKCFRLETVTIPDSVREIESFAFETCPDLRLVNIPESVKEIGESAFYACRSLTRVQIPGSVSVISEGMFSGCSNLKTVIIAEGVAEIRYGVFEYCENLEELHIPGSVTAIDSSLFFGCWGSELTIYAPAGSYAETYAKENNIPFVAE